MGLRADNGSFSRRCTMKTLKLTAFLVLAVLITMSCASRMVKSKRGDLDLLASRSGDKVLCIAHFNDILTLIKEVEADALVKGDCKGWVAKSKIEYVAKKAADRTIDIDNFDITAWTDNQSGVFVLENNIEDFDGVTIDRDFREYLTYTMDREQTEMRNGEN